MANSGDNKPLWTRGADADEIAAVRKIDKEIQELAKRRRVLSAERALITNRCIQRARYRAERKAS